MNDALLALERATRAGTGFVFGYLGGGPLPFAESPAGASFVLAFRALPIVLVVSALSAVLFYWRVLPWLVRAIAAVLEKALGVGGAVGLSTAANVFVGMVEAPLFVRPYLAQLSRGELFMVMTGGMAGIAGTVMVLYASIIGPVVPDAMGHILVASILSAPAAIVVAALMVPPAGVPTSGRVAPAQTAARAQAVADRSVSYPEVKDVLAHGDTKCSVVLRSGLQVDLRVVPAASYGAALYYFTGSKAHNIATRTLAVKKKLRVNEYGVFRGAKVIAGRTETDVMKAIGLPWIPPELREDRGEIEAALANRLPRLIERGDLAGDLHAHTDWSDGTASIAAMAQAARAQGLAYLAITDHNAGG